MLGALLLGMFCTLGLLRILHILRTQSLIASIVLSQFIFHALCLLVTLNNGLPLYIPVAFAASNGGALLIALADKRSFEQRGRTVFLFLLFFLVAVVWDFTTRYPLNGVATFVRNFRYGLELSGRIVGPNVFAYSLVLTTVVVFNFTRYHIALKRFVAAACLLGLVMVSARLATITMTLFMTLLCEDRRTRRYWIPVIIVLGVLVLWSLPDFLSSTRFVTLLEDRDTSNSTRADIYSDFLFQFDHLLFGSGQGAYFQDHGLSFHNDFMEIIYSSGAVGFLLFYGGQIATYLIIISKRHVIDRKVMSLFLVQFAFSMTESLSISSSSYTGIAFSYLLYSFAVVRYPIEEALNEIDVSSQHRDTREVPDLGLKPVQH
ncbi:O-antigen ligase family protein [Pararhizobium sp. A13]|uniref:O-antigen ligase family protein n=1 Tax=Pararhizobium sp. A13 TaxID=3133975 RepID=UPI00324DB0B3